MLSAINSIKAIIFTPVWHARTKQVRKVDEKRNAIPLGLQKMSV